MRQVLFFTAYGVFFQVRYLMLSFSISLAPMLAGVPWTVWFLRRLRGAAGQGDDVPAGQA